MGSGWLEIGDRVHVRRYAFYDQNIVVVRGHGDHGGLAFVEWSMDQLREVVATASLVQAGFLALEVAEHDGPYPAPRMKEPLAQLRGELDG